MPDKLTIDWSGEFTWDLVSIAPFAYWLYKRDMLEECIVPRGSESIYYFSPKIKAVYPRTGIHPGDTRLYKYNYLNLKGEIYGKELPDDRWELPPYREHFKNSRFVWDKPLLIISNKYTEEWGKGPVNFIHVESLLRIIRALSHKYTIVYIRPTYNERGIEYDGHGLYDWYDYDVLKKYLPGQVIYFNDLLKQNPDLDFNTLQFMLHANCDKCISCFGGNSAMCSIMGGTVFVAMAGHPGDGVVGHAACLFPDAYYSKKFGVDIRMYGHWNDLVLKSVECFGGDMSLL